MRLTRKLLVFWIFFICVSQYLHSCLLASLNPRGWIHLSMFHWCSTPVELYDHHHHYHLLPTAASSMASTAVPTTEADLYRQLGNPPSSDDCKHAALNCFSASALLLLLPSHPRVLNVQTTKFSPQSVHACVPVGQLAAAVTWTEHISCLFGFPRWASILIDLWNLTTRRFV